jgi:hypothetical protein
MRAHPSARAEAIAAFFTPPACREEVLGDLHERYRAPWPYAMEALRTIPLVIFSQIRRITDPQSLMIQAGTIYLAFAAAAWLNDPSLFVTKSGLFRLAFLAAIVLVNALLDDAFADRKPRNRLVTPARLALLIASHLGSTPGTLLRIWLDGWFISLILLAAVQMLFVSYRPRT